MAVTRDLRRDALNCIFDKLDSTMGTSLTFSAKADADSSLFFGFGFMPWGAYPDYSGTQVISGVTPISTRDWFRIVGKYAALAILSRLALI